MNGIRVSDFSAPIEPNVIGQCQAKITLIGFRAEHYYVRVNNGPDEGKVEPPENVLLPVSFDDMLVQCQLPSNHAAAEYHRAIVRVPVGLELYGPIPNTLHKKTDGRTIAWKARVKE